MVDVARGAAVAANDNKAIGAVVPPFLTKDEDAYIGALVAAHLRTVPVNLPQPPRCCHRAAAVALCATAGFGLLGLVVGPPPETNLVGLIPIAGQSPTASDIVWLASFWRLMKGEYLSLS